MSGFLAHAHDAAFPAEGECAGRAPPAAGRRPACRSASGSRRREEWKPARNWSCDCRALSRTGPTVGRLSTTETMTEPETSEGIRLPISAMNGLSAMRSGYLTSRRASRRPLARAVVTYCLCSSSRRLARNRRIIAAVPAVPMTTVGTIRCARIDSALATLQGWPIYSGAISPPTDRPNQRLAK